MRERLAEEQALVASATSFVALPGLFTTMENPEKHEACAVGKDPDS